MVTNEERREVARKLRETSDAIRYWLDTNPYWYVMKCVYGDVEIHDDNELLYRLADLIEPESWQTCHMVQDPDYDFVACSKCGYEEEANVLYELGGKVIYGGNYCPHCGAKVVEDD